MKRLLLHTFLFCVVALPVSALTQAELQSQIELLLQQIRVLQSQIASSGGSTVTNPNVSSGNCPVITRTLLLGMSGDDVAGLQDFLASDTTLYPEASITGYFGPLTERAVQRFQSRHDIVRSGSPSTTGFGVVGLTTRTAIRAVCSGTVTANPPTTTPVVRPPVVTPPVYTPPVYTPPVVTTPVTYNTCRVADMTIGSGAVMRLYSVTTAPEGYTCSSFESYRQCQNGTLSGNPANVYSTCTEAPRTTCTVDNVVMKNGETRTFYQGKNLAYGEQCVGVTRSCINGILSGSVDYFSLTCSANTTPASCTSDGITLQHTQSRTFYKKKELLPGQSCADFDAVRTCTNGVLSGDADFKYESCAVAAAKSCSVFANGATTTVANDATKSFWSRSSVVYNGSCDPYKVTRTCKDGDLLPTSSASYIYPTCEVIPEKTCTLDGITVAGGATHTFYTNTSVAKGVSCTTIAQARKCTNGVLSGTATYKYGACAPVGQRWCKLSDAYVEHGKSRTFYSQTVAPLGTACTQFGLSRTCSDSVLGGSATYANASCTTATGRSCVLDGKTVLHGQTYAFYSTKVPPSGDSCVEYKQLRECFDGNLDGSDSFKYQTCK